MRRSGRHDAHLLRQPQHGAYCRTLLLIEDGLFEVAWHFVRYRGYDISVKDGSARRSRQLPGVPLTCTSPTYPQGVRP